MLTKRQKLEIGAALLFIVPALYALFEIVTKFTEQGYNSGGGRDDAGMYPELLAWVLLLLAGVRIVSVFFEARSNVETESADFTIFKRKGLKRTLGMFVTFVLYLVILPYLGYLAATALALVVSLAILGVRKLYINIPVAMATDLLVWFVFSKLLNIVLPPGIFGLYI